MKVLFINGVFFQNREQLEIGEDPSCGTAVFIHKDLFRYVYAGVIWTEPSGGLRGLVQDAFGEAELSHITISDTEISFTKKYFKRDYYIEYFFRIRNGNTWVGDYKGVATGNGISRCILTEIEDEFFLPQPILKLLGRTKAHISILDPE